MGVEDDGELQTINLCKDCYNSRQGETMEPVRRTNNQWKLPVAEKRSRGKLSTGLGARCLEFKNLRGQEDLREKLVERSCRGSV